MFGLGQDVIGTIPGASINSLEDWDSFAKAAQESSYQTDHANLTGMAAIRRESLEPTLRSVVAQSDSFTFWRELRRQPVTSAVHEWMTQISRGGQADGMNISEMGEIQFDAGDYRRKVERLKLFATGAKITDFANVQAMEGEALRARENESSLVRIGNAVERALFVSNEKYNPNKINGFIAQVENWNNGSNVIDMEGSSDVEEFAHILFQCKADVRQEGNYGDISDVFVDAYTQNALDNHLMSQYRVQLDNNPASLQLGAPVGAIKTSFGNIGLKHTIWNNNAANSLPTIVKNRNRLPDKVPSKPTITVTPVAAGAQGSSLRWTAERAGEYYYAVAFTDADGREGLPSDIVSGTVAENGALLIKVTETPGTVTPTGGKLYRSTQDPETAPTLRDLRYAGEFVLDADGETIFIDTNQYIPGSSNVPVTNLKRESIQWLQLRPATQIPLFSTNTLTVQWAVALYGTLQLGQPQHHYWIKNFVPEHAPWKAFKKRAA